MRITELAFEIFDRLLAQAAKGKRRGESGIINSMQRSVIVLDHEIKKPLIIQQSASFASRS